MTKEQQNRTRSFGKRMLAVVLVLVMILSLIVVGLVFQANAAGTQTITVGVITYLGSGNYQVHYWGGSSGDGDVNLVSSGTTQQESVGSAYWNNEAQTFNMYTAQIPADATNFKVRNGNTWFGSDATIANENAAYVFEYGGNYLAKYKKISTPGPDPQPSGNKYTAPVNTSNSANNSGIFWADATYYDYLSDEEISSGWLKPVHAGTSNFNGAIDEWYPFYLFNREIVKTVADSNSGWSKPLYFGNFCNTYNAYDTGHHPGVTNGYTDATSSYNVTRFDYPANNSNGVYDRYTSVQGLMGSTLNNERQLQTPNGTVAPYFDEATLGDKARVVESKFPFRISDMGSFTRYEFDSTNATDNVYFTWETSGGKTYPKYVNYGAGTTYGVKDGIKDFMNTDSGYGIFPFNNASGNYKGTKTYANDNLDYGFGIRMDMKFRVPSDTDVKFDFSGDDDLWMYITDETTKESQLVLDMGGSHKESEGVVDFNNGTATVKKVDNRSATNKDIWIMDQSNWGNIIIYAWDDSGNNDWFYGEKNSNLYRFRDNIKGKYSDKTLGEMKHFLFAKNENYDGNSGNLEISARAGRCSYTDNVGYTNTDHVESGHCEEKVTNFSFNTSHTYTMTIFYMERGLIESNCKMGFTLTPMGNNVIVTETLNTTNVNSGLVNKVKQLSSFDFVPYENNTAQTSQNFTLSDGGIKVFPDVFDTASNVKIQQKTNSHSYLSYTTDYEYYNNVSEALLESVSGGSTAVGNPTTTGNQVLIDPTTNDPYDFAELEIDFTNTPDVGSFSVLKEVNDNEDHSNETFPVTILLKFADNESFAAYRLQTSAGYTTNAGKINLVPNQTVTVSGVPKGARVYVVEDSSQLYTVGYSHSSGSPLIVGGSGGSTITVTNTPVIPGAIYDDITAVKTFDDENYSGDMFTFKIEGLAPFQGDPNTVVDTSDVDVTVTDCINGEFTFDDLEYDQPGTYRYHIYEDMESIQGATYYSDIYGLNTHYLVTVTVAKTIEQGSPKLTVTDTVYVPYTPNPTAGITADDFNQTPVSAIEIHNFTQDCSVNIEKKNQANQPLGGVVFAVYKLTDSDVNTLSNMTDAEKYAWITDKYSQPDYTQTTNSSGAAQFSDLPIYQDGYTDTTSSNPKYQKYCLIEYGYTGNTSGYAINKTVNIFKFPVLDNQQNPQYHMTFSYENGAIKAPEAGVSGVANVMYTGIAFVVLSMALLAAYVLVMKKKGYIFVRFKK